MRYRDCRDNCPIPNGGYCPRHKTKKVAPWVRLCITRPDYWRLWEAGRGPGQLVPVVHDAEQRALEMPSLVARAWNLTRSLAAFVSDGCTFVSKDEYERRLTICDGCEFRSGNWCSQCGCKLSLKASGRAFQCPVGRWKR